jgi:hypothetical protein
VRATDFETCLRRGREYKTSGLEISAYIPQAANGRDDRTEQLLSVLRV